MSEEIRTSKTTKEIIEEMNKIVEDMNKSYDQKHLELNVLAKEDIGLE